MIPDETTRLRMLASYGVMETGPDEALDEMVALASAICDTPIALVSLVDGTRQWVTRELTKLQEQALATLSKMVVKHLRGQRDQAESLTAKAQLHAVFQQAPVAITELRGPDHVIELANEEVCRIWGRTQAEVLGKPLFEALPEVRGQGLEALLAGVLETGVAFVAKELPIKLLRAKGAPLLDVYFTFVYQALRGAGDRIEGILVFAVDVTEQVLGRQKMEEVARERQLLFDEQEVARDAAETANRAMDQFLATVSHELRTPLNAVLGWTRLLRTGQVAEAQRGKALATVERNALAQLQLVDDLLDVSRIISGKMRIELMPVELVNIVEGALEVVRPAAEAKGVRLETLLDPAAGPVTGDSSRLQQVIWNLLSNAVKFTPKGGHVQIRLARAEASVEISVTDTGEGIRADFLPHVFERFRQAEGAMSRAHGGLGLGLAIVKNIVELHGGVILAESGGPDLGASFTVRLPASQATALAGVPLLEHRPERMADFDWPKEIIGLRVLIVDDEDDSRDLLSLLLEQSGAIVTSASSAAAAMEAFLRGSIAVVISDIGMPGEDGYSLVKKIRALPPSQGGRVPIVALTAYARTEDRTRALRAGFNAHVAKPVETSELLAVVASMVRS